jgi:PAS domain S-box-containing protein
METKTKKILAIDDNYDNLIVLKALMEEAFPLAELIVAQSGKTGIELCYKHKPDLILLDIVMPIMDGYEVCKALKNNNLSKIIPIVMVTAARTDREGRIKAIEAGADGFLTKPLDESELIAQVRAMLRIKEAEDQKINEKERLETIVKERTEALLSELSERKKAEEKLHLAYLKVEESKQDVLKLINNLETEILERKKIEITQNDANRKYAEAQRIAHIGSWEENLLTGKSYWSEEMYQIFGITGGTPIFWKEIKQCLPPDDLILLDQTVETALKDRKFYSVDYKIIHPKLGVRYIHDECEVVRDEHDHPIGIMGTSHDITYCKLIENALKESEEHFQMLFDNAPVGYQSLDINGNFLAVNNTWLELMGYAREEVVGKWFGSFLAPGYTEAFRERFPLFIEWGSVHSEFEMVKKDGSIIIAAFEGRIGHTVSGEFKQTHCVIDDVTEQRRKESELKQIYEFNNSLLNTIPFGMNIVDDKGTILFQNEIFKDYFGRKILRKKCRDLHRDSSYDYKDCPLKKSLGVGETHLCEAIDILGGKTFDISHIGMIYQGKKAMLEIFQDVTERKRAELIQKVLYAISYAVLTTKDLEELYEFIRIQLGQLIDTTNFCIAYYDENTGLLTPQYISDQKNIVLPWSADRSLTGHVISNNKSLILKKEEILEMNRIGEIDLIGDLSEVWLGVPLREDGKAIGAFIIQNYLDVNTYTVKDLELLEFVSHQVSISIQRKKGLQNLVIALEKAEESDRLKTAFLSNMSHEIRTPMNGILGFSELLDDDELSIEERRKFLDIINTNGQHLLSIINDILDIARIDSNQLVVNNTDFNLHQMLDDLWISYENSKMLMGKGQITILNEKEGNDTECKIICDEVRLRQILYNLLGNALKFTKTGFIKFGYNHLDSKLQFYVQDTGIGISKRINLLYLSDSDKRKRPIPASLEGRV